MNDGISLEEYLEEHGTLTYANTGVSMMPLLRQGRDLFIAEKKGPGRCRAGDVVLYRRPPDQYVSREYGITDGDIIGVMTGYVRGGKTHSVGETGYRVYSSLWMATAGPRIFAKRAAMKIRRCLKKRN